MKLDSASLWLDSGRSCKSSHSSVGCSQIGLKQALNWSLSIYIFFKKGNR